VERFGGCASAAGHTHLPVRGAASKTNGKTKRTRGATPFSCTTRRALSAFCATSAHIAEELGELVELFGGAEQPHECRYGA
jgi:hypothetical protein